MLCPRCESPTRTRIDRDSARCNQCGFVCLISELLPAQVSLLPGESPTGTSISIDDHRTVIIATARTPMCLVYLAVSAGVLSFASVALIASYRESPDLMKIFGPVCTAIFLAGLWLLWHAALRIFGRVQIEIRADEGFIFTGIGSIGRTKRFRVSQVWYVRRRRDIHQTQHGAFVQNSLVLNGSFDAITFATALTEDRREFLHTALVRTLPIRAS